MSAGILVRVELRHALVGGSEPSSQRRRLIVRVALLAGASAAAALVATRSERLEQQAALVAVLVPALVHLAVGFAAMLLDQTCVRDGRGPLRVLPVGRGAQRRIRRAPWIVLLATVVLAAAPTLLVVLAAAGVPLATGAGVLLLSALSGLGSGLLCSVVGSLVRPASRAGLAAPIATLVWVVWTAVSAYAQRFDGWWDAVLAPVAGWPAALDLLQAEISPLGACGVLLLWTLGVWWVGGAPVASEMPSSARVTWSFRRTPFARTVLLRCIRHPTTRAHWSVAALLVGCLLGVDLWRSGPQTEQIALTVVIMTVAVCACAARSLDGPVPLDVRWFVGAGRHVVAVLGASSVLVAPLAVAVLGHLVIAGRLGPTDVVLWMTACLSAGAVGTLVSATSGARVGDAWVETAVIVVVLSSLAAAGLVAGDGFGLVLALFLSGLAAAAGAVLSARRLARSGLQS